MTTITDFIYFRFPEPFLGGPLPLWRRFLNLTCLLSCNSLVYSGTSEQVRCIYTDSDRSVIRILTNIRGEQIFFVDVIIYITISAMDYRRDGINPRIMCTIYTNTAKNFCSLPSVLLALSVPCKTLPRTPPSVASLDTACQYGRLE